MGSGGERAVAIMMKRQAWRTEMEHRVCLICFYFFLIDSPFGQVTSTARISCKKEQIYTHIHLKNTRVGKFIFFEHSTDAPTHIYAHTLTL